MDLNELIDIFDDNDEEILEFIRNLRTYTVRERPNHFAIWNDSEFFRRFRFRKDTIRNLLPRIIEHLRPDNEWYHQIDPLGQLLLTIRFYGTGQFYVSTGDFGGIHKTTTGRIIRRVTDVLLTLQQEIIQLPQDEESRGRIKGGFYGIASFPNVIGAIDCTRIPIQSRGGPNAETFRNRKGIFSLNTQVICDSRHYIHDIVARWLGSAHDSHIFRNSFIKQRLENGEFGESVLLGDSAYPLCNYLLTPLPNPNIPAEELYNRSHISTRTVVERTFGIWKRRFAVLRTGLRCKTVLAQRIIVATAVLHNVAVLSRDELDYQRNGGEDDNQDDHLLVGNGQNNNLNNHILQTYIQYFDNRL